MEEVHTLLLLPLDLLHYHWSPLTLLWAEFVVAFVVVVFVEVQTLALVLSLVLVLALDQVWAAVVAVEAGIETC